MFMLKWSRYPILLFEHVPGFKHSRIHLVRNINFLWIFAGNDLVRMKLDHVLLVRLAHLVLIHEFVHGDACPSMTFPQHIWKGAKQNPNVVLARVASPVFQTLSIILLSPFFSLIGFNFLLLDLFIPFISRLLIVTVLGLFFLFWLRILACWIVKLDAVKGSQKARTDSKSTTLHIRWLRCRLWISENVIKLGRLLRFFFFLFLSCRFK